MRVCQGQRWLPSLREMRCTGHQAFLEVAVEGEARGGWCAGLVLGR